MAEPASETSDAAVTKTEDAVDTTKTEDADQLYADVEAGGDLAGDGEESSSGEEEESEDEVMFLLDKNAAPVERQASRQTKTHVRTGDGEEKERVVESKAFSLPEPNEDQFKIDIDGLEEKPWRKPGADITDYFNYGFVEASWREYCKKQIKMRMESQMQNTIQVLDSDTHGARPPAGDRFPKPDANQGNNNNNSNNNNHHKNSGGSGRRHGSSGPRNQPPQFSPRGGMPPFGGRPGNRGFPHNAPPFMPPNFVGRGMPPPFMHGPRGPMPGNFNMNPNFTPGPPNMGFGFPGPHQQSSEFEVPLVNNNGNNNSNNKQLDMRHSGQDSRSRSGSRPASDRRDRGRKRSRSPRRSPDEEKRESSRSRSDRHQDRDRERGRSRDHRTGERERRSSRSRERKKRR